MGTPVPTKATILHSVLLCDVFLKALDLIGK